jgi:AcrR family transcriptional regulator
MTGCPVKLSYMDGRIERGQATRRRLLAVASELFAERGYEGTAIETVLERADLSKGSLYHHFANKRDLYEAVLEETEARLARSTVLAARGAGDPAEGLRAGCKAFLRLARDPAISRIVLRDAPTVVGWARWREIDERHAFGILRRGVAATPAAERLSRERQDVLAHVLLASLIELAMIIASSETPRAAQSSAQAVLDELIDRLLT